MLVARGREVLARLARRGIHIPSPNRLANAIQLTDALNEGHRLLSEGDIHGQRAALNAFRTLFEAFVIVWTAEERPRRVNPFPNERLAYLLQGRDGVQPGATDPARDIQFELYVGAYLVLCGLEARAIEPDYCTEYRGEVIGVAAKRVSSAKPAALRARLRKAAQQLRRNNLRGFVALSVDPWIPDLSGSTIEDVGEQFNDQLARAHAIIQDQSEKSAVLGAIIFGHWSRFEFSNGMPRLIWREPIQTYSFVEDEAELTSFVELHVGMRNRYENAVRELGHLLI